MEKSEIIFSRLIKGIVKVPLLPLSYVGIGIVFLFLMIIDVVYEIGGGKKNYFLDMFFEGLSKRIGKK